MTRGLPSSVSTLKTLEEPCDQRREVGALRRDGAGLTLRGWKWDQYASEDVDLEGTYRRCTGARYLTFLVHLTICTWLLHLFSKPSPLRAESINYFRLLRHAMDFACC